MTLVNALSNIPSKAGKRAKLAGAALVLSQLVAGFGLAQSASAAIFTYDLLDGSNGALGAEEYGVRIDDLFSSPNNFSFSFEDFTSDVSLEVDTTAKTARIFGIATGGEDLGAGRRFGGGTRVSLDFLFNDGVNILDATTGFFEVAPGSLNYGSLTLLDALAVNPAVVGSSEVSATGVIALSNFSGGNIFTSDEVVIDLLTSDNVLVAGTPLPLASTDYTSSGTRQFDFKVAGLPATPVVSTPEPSVLLLMGLGLLGLGVSRKLKS